MNLVSLLDESGDPAGDKYVMNASFQDLNGDKKLDVVFMISDNCGTGYYEVLLATGNKNNPYKSAGFESVQYDLEIFKNKHLFSKNGSQGLFSEYFVRNGVLVEFK